MISVSDSATLAACRLRKLKTELSNTNNNTLFVIFNYLNYCTLTGKYMACIICKNGTHNPEKRLIT